MLNAANFLKQKELRRSFWVSYFLFLKGFKYFQNYCIDKVIANDLIEKVYDIKFSKIYIVSLAHLLFNIITWTVENKSIFNIYKKNQLAIKKY